ncbi:MAG: hypothetical protein ACLRMX_12730 [Lachnospira eligens]
MRKKSLMLAAVLVAGVMMAACGNASTLEDNSQDKPVASQQTESKYSFELKGVELKTDGDLTEYTSKLESLLVVTMRLKAVHLKEWTNSITMIV